MPKKKEEKTNAEQHYVHCLYSVPTLCRLELLDRGCLFPDPQEAVKNATSLKKYPKFSYALGYLSCISVCTYTLFRHMLVHKVRQKESSHFSPANLFHQADMGAGWLAGSRKDFYLWRMESDQVFSTSLSN